MITKEEADKVMGTEGKTRGMSIKGDLEFVKFKQGEKGLKKVLDEMEKLGHPLSLKMKAMDFCPVG
jgi:hypothetical protein